jgi:hypothetical protein
VDSDRVIILPEPDPVDSDRYNSKHIYFVLFSRKFQYGVQNTHTQDNFATDEKGKTM